MPYSVHVFSPCPPFLLTPTRLYLGRVPFELCEVCEYRVPVETRVIVLAEVSANAVEAPRPLALGAFGRVGT